MWLFCGRCVLVVVSPCGFDERHLIDYQRHYTRQFNYHSQCKYTHFLEYAKKNALRPLSLKAKTHPSRAPARATQAESARGKTDSPHKRRPPAARAAFGRATRRRQAGEEPDESRGARGRRATMVTYRRRPSATVAGTATRRETTRRQYFFRARQTARA